MLCQTGKGPHNPRMKSALQMTAAGFTAMLLASCGTTGSGGSVSNHPSGTGPFDSRGNYVEAWADNPSKWKRGGGVPSKPGESLVMNDEPPANSVPIPTAENTRQPGPIASAPMASATRTVRNTSSTKTTATRRPASSSTASKSKSKSATASRAKTKKPTSSRYTIIKGDTLSAIAARNRTTVSALQRANGIKGSLIRPGWSLVIPR